jgi:Spy/CpxP family protein refolding chaperone
MMEMMKKSQTETDAQLKKVLTADQYKNYQEIQKKRMEEMRQRGPRGPRGGGFPRN